MDMTFMQGEVVKVVLIALLAVAGIVIFWRAVGGK